MLIQRIERAKRGSVEHATLLFVKERREQPKLNTCLTVKPFSVWSNRVNLYILECSYFYVANVMDKKFKAQIDRIVKAKSVYKVGDRVKIIGHSGQVKIFGTVTAICSNTRISNMVTDILYEVQPDKKDEGKLYAFLSELERLERVEFT